MKLLNYTIISLLFFLNSAHSQIEKSANDNDIAVKGIHLGMSRAAAEEILGSSDRPKHFSVAGVIAKSPPVILNRFIDDKLSSFTFSFSSSDFVLVMSAVKEKYPQLKCEVSEVKNKMGAKFEQTKCVIKSQSGNLALSKYYFDINSGALTMISDEEMERRRQEFEKKKKDI